MVAPWTVPGNALTCDDVPSVPVCVTPVMARFAPAAVVAPVPPDAGSNGDPSVSLPAVTAPENDALVPLIGPVNAAPEI
jgi:hypothetical protein